MPFLGTLVALRPFSASLGAAGACAFSFLAGGGGKPTSPLSTWAADRRVATEIAVSDVEDLVGLAGADDGAEASVIPPSPILEILSGVWEATPSAPELPLSMGRLLLPLERQSSLSDPEESPGRAGSRRARGPPPWRRPRSKSTYSLCKRLAY